MKSLTVRYQISEIIKCVLESVKYGETCLIRFLVLNELMHAKCSSVLLAQMFAVIIVVTM